MSAESAGRRPVRHVSRLSEARLGHAAFSPRGPLNGSGRGLGGGGAPLLRPPSVAEAQTHPPPSCTNCSPGPGTRQSPAHPGEMEAECRGDGVREARDSALGNRPQCPCNGGAWECPPAGLVRPASVSVPPYQAPPAPSAPDPWSHIVVILTGTCPAPPLPAERFQKVLK